MAKNVKPKQDEKFRARTFELMIYPDNQNHVDALSYIKKNFDEYCYILHDKDKLDDGTLKKAHWHIVLRFKNAIWNTALAKQLGIEEKWIQDIKNFDRCLEYLVHFNEPTKHQYAVDDVHGILRKRLEFNLNKGEKSLEEKVDNILDYISQQEQRITITQMVRYVNSNDLYSTFRQGFAMYSRIIEEHNYNISKLENDAYYNLTERAYVNMHIDADGFQKNCSFVTGEINSTPYDQEQENVSCETYFQQKLTLEDK